MGNVPTSGAAPPAREGRSTTVRFDLDVKLLPGGRRALTAYARWLDSISWMRFVLLSLLALIISGVLQGIPPFNIPWGRDRTELRDVGGDTGDRPKVPIRIEGVKGRDGERYEIRIDGSGVQVRPLPQTAPPDAAQPASQAAPAEEPTAREAAEALTEAREALAQTGLLRDGKAQEVHIRAYRLGDGLPQLAFLLILLSLVIKVMAAGRFRAEAQAEQATEKAESESLRRQVVEARMAAMQAQVEPHFLFNTLASIEHLIETDPPRAGQMQRNLIALLRASMPSLRETGSAAGPRELRRELEMVRPYLEILKVRMDERLAVRIDVPDGLLSAEFPPMMIQGLVENAIKHGLEPKADGGRLEVTAAIEHGRLVVRVADTGLGFGRAATAGTGTGLANIRERLTLLYGDRAALAVAENPGGGTVATITLPYRSLHATASA
jgi:signal transduction histidine kinase